MKLEYRTWSKREQRVLKLSYSIHFVHAVYTFKYLSDLAQVRVLLALNQVTQFIHFYHKLLQFFNEYDNNPNCNNCVSQYICLICCLLTFNMFLSHKTHFKAKANICFCLHSLKDDVIDDGYNFSCVKCGFFKDSFLVVY